MVYKKKNYKSEQMPFYVNFESMYIFKSEFMCIISTNILTENLSEYDTRLSTVWRTVVNGSLYILISLISPS